MTEFRSSTDTGIEPDEPPHQHPGKYVDRVCKMGHGAACCRYLAAGPRGLECLKLTPMLKKIIDERSAAGLMGAKGDNCDGLTSDVMRSSD